MIPNWYTLILLGLAAWRVYELLANDDILDRPRCWVLRLDPNWEEPQPVGEHYRYALARFIRCARCFGFWVAVSWWVAWLIFPHATTIVAVPFAVSTIIIALATSLTE